MDSTSESKKSILIVSDGLFLEHYLVEQFRHKYDVRLLHTDDIAHIKTLQRHYDTVIYCPTASENFKHVKGLFQAMETQEPENMVLISSYEIYGRGSDMDAVSETSPLEPVSKIGQDLYECEKVLTKWAGQKDVKLTILRCGEIIGNNMTGRIRCMTDRIASGMYFHIPGYDEGTLVLIHAEDLAAIIDFIIGKKVILNISDGYTHYYKETADAIARRLNDKRILTMPRKLVPVIKLLSHVIPSLATMLALRSCTITYNNDAMMAALEGRVKPRNVTDYLKHMDNQIPTNV